MARELVFEFPDDDELNNLNTQFGEFAEQKQYMKCISVCDKACTTYRTKYGKQIFSKYSGMYYVSLYNLAQSYEWAHDYANSESTYLEALEFLRTICGENSTFACVLADLASLYFKMENDNDSRSLFGKAIQILEDLGKVNDQTYKMIINDYKAKFPE